jgi:tyrosine-protein kinase Etk/Wzc
MPLGFSALLITVKDIFNAKILYRTDIEKLTSFPIIGEIIFQKLKNPIVTDNTERSFIVEQFRLIRTALKHQAKTPGSLKRILVTSSVKGDGKSFVSVNLAVSMARSGKKVVILEMDLHQPKLSAMLDIPKCDGITDYLLGKVNENDIILPLPKYPNLSMVPVGYLSEDPSELLASSRLDDLFSYLDSEFDYIVVDTSPLKALTDAFIIAPYCDLVLNVVRHNHTPKSHIEILNKDMEAYNIKNVAIVFNGIKKRGVGRYSYGYGHGYGYDNRSTYEQYSKKKSYKIV